METVLIITLSKDNTVRNKNIRISHQIVFSQDASLVEVVLDHVEEVRILRIRNMLEPFRDGPSSGGRGRGVETGGCEDSRNFSRGRPD